jgi:hypothetical protein
MLLGGGCRDPLENLSLRLLLADKQKKSSKADNSDKIKREILEGIKGI